MRFSLHACLALLSLFTSSCHYFPTIAAAPPVIGGAHRQKPEIWVKPAPSGTPDSPSIQAEDHPSMASLDPDSHTGGPPAQIGIGKWGFAEPFVTRRVNPPPSDYAVPILTGPPGKIAIGKCGFAEPFIYSKGPPARIDINEWPFIKPLIHSGGPPA